MDLPSSLTEAELKLIRADLKALGRQMPDVGYKIQLSNGTNVARDVHGYYLDGPFPGVTTPLAKGNVYVMVRPPRRRF